MVKPGTSGTVADTVRAVRVRRGLSQGEVAGWLGLSGTAYGHYERGRSALTVDQLATLSECLGVPMSYLLGETTAANATEAAVPNEEPDAASRQAQPTRRPSSPELARIGNQIRRRRQHLRLTQSQLAAAIGLRPPAISQYEAGKRDMPLSRLTEFAGALHCPASYFLAEDETEEAAVSADLIATLRAAPPAMRRIALRAVLAILDDENAGEPARPPRRKHRPSARRGRL